HQVGSRPPDHPRRDPHHLGIAPGHRPELPVAGELLCHQAGRPPDLHRGLPFLAVDRPPASGGFVMTAVPIKVLMVEDNPLDVQLVRELLRFSAPGAVEITHVECMSEVPAQVKLGTDVVLLDLGLPDAQGPGAVRKARAMAPTVPLVVWTGLEDEALAAQVLKEGAQDYLVKGKLDGDGLLQVLRRSIQRQRTQVETDHIRALQIQLRDEFLSDVSHELRTPLTAIYQFSTIIADGLSGPTTPEQQEHLEIIRRNVEQVRAMIEDLLDAGRAEGGTLSIEPECTSLADVIAYTVTTLQGPAQEKKITLSFEIPPDLPP